MKNALNSVKISTPSTNAFDLSHDVKLSCNMGELVPVLALECLPGDRIKLGCENVIRLAPMLAPMMHRVDTRVEYFFVPNRLIWENWERWITNGGDAPQNDPPDPLPAHPFVEYNADGSGGFAAYNDLLDYFGLPDPTQCPEPLVPEKISALPFAAYQRIFNDYYRDENLQEPVFNELIDGDNTSTWTGTVSSSLGLLRKRAWEADYFTKALPFAQKGQPVDLPLGTFEDVEVKMFRPVGTVGTILQGVPDNVPITGGQSDPVFTGQLYAETSQLTGATAATINDLRLAFRLQEWLEKNARGGTRYSELIRAHFNVRPEDSRLQRPEYIVGVKNPIQISEVLNTTGTDENPQGNMAGHGISYARGNNGKYFCTEHGYVIGILSIMPKTAYLQGIPKHFMKYTDPTELAWPVFGNLGEQEIQNREIMAFQDTASQLTWGYTPRYMEYKNLPSRVCGDFRTTLLFWHMARFFDPLTPPLLNEDFIEADPTTRVFAVTEEIDDHIYCQLMHHITAVRALPFYGTPSF